MRAEEVFAHKPYLDKLDIMNIYACGKNRAYAIMRAIHYVSNVLGMDNKVSEQDYYNWFNKTNKGS